MSTHPRFWLITCIVLAISSCSAFGQQAGVVLRGPTGNLHSVPTALSGDSELAATCGDTLADVGSPSSPAMLCSAVGTFAHLSADGGAPAGH